MCNKKIPTYITDVNSKKRGKSTRANSATFPLPATDDDRRTITMMIAID